MIIIDFSIGRAVSDCDALGKILFSEPEVAKKILATKDKSSFSYFGDPEGLDNQLLENGLTDAANEIKNIKKKYSVNGQITDTGRLCAAYYLSPSLTYFMFGFKPIKKISDLPLIWQTYGLKGRNGAKLVDSLSDPAFTYWLWHRDPQLALKVRSMQERNASSGEIAYAMFPGMSYNFIVDTDGGNRIITPKQIGEDLNEKIADYITNNRVISPSLIDFGLEPGGSTEGYLKADKIFAPQLFYYEKFIRNRRQWALGNYAPYNPYVSLFSFVKALGFKPYYQFSDGTKVYDLEQLKKMPAAKIEQALNSGYLSAWIATFFQENPDIPFKDDVEYAKEAVKFTNFLNSICPSYLPVVKYNKAINEIDETAKKYQKTTRFNFVNLLLKLILVPVTFLLFLLVILLTFEFRIPDYNIIANHYIGFSLAIGIAVLIFSLFVGNTFYEGLKRGAIVGFGGTLILKLLMKFISPYLTWVYLAIVLAAFIYFIVKLWRVYEIVPGYAYVIDIAHPDFKLREMNALRYAYGSKTLDDRGDDDISLYLHNYKKYRKFAQKSQFRYVCGGIVTAIMLIFGLSFLSPAFGEEHCIMYDSPDKEAIETAPAEQTDSDKPKAKKKSNRKSKSKTKETTAPEDNSDANSADNGTENEEIIEIKNEDLSVTDVLD